MVKIGKKEKKITKGKNKAKIYFLQILLILINYQRTWLKMLKEERWYLTSRSAEDELHSTASRCYEATTCSAAARTREQQPDRENGDSLDLAWPGRNNYCESFLPSFRPLISSAKRKAWQKQ